jgi:hypothetical protein
VSSGRGCRLVVAAVESADGQNVVGKERCRKLPSYDQIGMPLTLAAEVRQAFAEFLAEDIVAAVWPDPSAGLRPQASSTELLSAAEKLLDPRLLAAELVRATVQIAAFHAGIPFPVARVMGQVAKDVFVSLLAPDPDAPKVEAVQYVDFTLSAKDGSLINNPALREIVVGETADVIDRLLGADVPESPSRASPAGSTVTPAHPAGQPPARSDEPGPSPQPSTAPRPHRDPRPGPGFGR